MWSFFARDPSKDFPYEIGEPVTSDSDRTHSLWTIHNAKKKATGEEVSVFVFDMRTGNDTQFDVAKTAMKRLKTLRHPSILPYLDGLESDKVIYFATEVVEPLEKHLAKLSREGHQRDLYLSWGIFQITRALSFLNNDCNLRHNNVCLASVFVNSAGEWKLGGLEYVAGVSEGTGLPIKILPALEKYNPPEQSDPNRQRLVTKCSTDIWGLGCLIWEAFNGPLPHPSNLRNIDHLPKNLVPVYNELIGSSPANRPNPADVITRLRRTAGYFKNDLVDVLLFLEEIQIKEKGDKAKFFAGLAQQVDQFPDHICRHKVLPQLITAFDYGDAGSAVLAPMFKLGRLLPEGSIVPESRRVLTRLKSDTGEAFDRLFDLTLDVTPDKLQLILNHLLQNAEPAPYLFFINDKEITSSLGQVLEKDDLGTEEVIEIVYQQQAVFKVRAVTRCTSSMPGHAEAVISVSFSPNGLHLASGSGDTTVRFWDIHTQTPHHVCEGHKNWVLCIAWSPDSKKLASACKNGVILLWDPVSGKQIGKPLTGHKQWVTSLSWEPLHRDPKCRRLASAAKDGDIRIWDTILGQVQRILTSHTMSVTCVRWGGGGLIYSSSQDRTLKVWRPDDGILCRTLEGHGHWVNSITLNTDYVLRTGAVDPTAPYRGKGGKLNEENIQSEAQARYSSVCGEGDERLVSASDDFTLFLWAPEKEKKPLARLTGHQQLVNDVKFSPDTRILASASFDKSIKLWEGRTGKFITTLRGHVQAVYMVAWSADSRLLVSGSADSTLKVWSVRNKKLELDLPGHADEVFAVDWSPDGLRVASGGKDKVLKIWQH